MASIKPRAKIIGTGPGLSVRVMRGKFYLIKNREVIPVVIGNRIHEVREILTDSKSMTGVLKKLKVLFGETKVHVGEYWTPDGRKRSVFIRNGFKGSAHFLIERI